MRKVTVLLIVLLLAGCNLPQVAPSPTQPPAFPVTDTHAVQDCYFNWATQPLPDLSEQVQAAMDKAGLRRVQARAEAYGENCYDSVTNQVAYFSALETDYHITADVTDLKDLDALGRTLEQILVVLDQFPTQSSPGPQAGYVGVRFTDGDQDLNLWFLLEDAWAARDKGLHGRELLEQLQKK